MTTLHPRARGDRRTRPTPLVSRYSLFGGRRRAVRRVGDATAVYVDRVSTGTSLAVLAIFFLHCLDAIFTVLHLERGGQELNPVMDYFLQRGVDAFLVAKLGMAAAGLVFLGLHQNFPYVRASLAGLFTVFTLLVGYHCVLIALS